MIRIARALASAAAIVVASGCAHQPRLAAAWYLTPETPATPVAIWLLNRGHIAGDVLEVHLNKAEGFALVPAQGKFPAHLDAGETLVLSAGGPSCACGPEAPAQGPPPRVALRGCLPVRLFVKTRYGQHRLQPVEIDHPLPSAYAPEALLACP